MLNFAIIGLGYISQRHIQAIKDIGGRLLMACDIDIEKKNKLSDDTLFFTNYKEMLANPEFQKIDWISICTPNYLHFPMIKDALVLNKKVLCEKPLVIDKSDLEWLKNKNNIFTVLQLRHNTELQEFKKSLTDKYYKGYMKIFVNRGSFYHNGWKGIEKQSGGLLFNIGIHYFDLLNWFFGLPRVIDPWTIEKTTSKGRLVYNNATIMWEISIDAPMDNQYKTLEINGQKIDLTRHFEDLHTKVYKDILKEKGITPVEAAKSLNTIFKIYELFCSA